MAQHFDAQDVANGASNPGHFDIDTQLESWFGLLPLGNTANPDISHHENASDSQVLPEDVECLAEDAHTAIFNASVNTLPYMGGNFSHDPEDLLFPNQDVAIEARQCFPPRAVAFVKTWIAESHGTLPSQEDIAWLARGTGQSAINIESIFGLILRGDDIPTTTSLRNTSLESLSNRAHGLHLQLSDTGHQERDVLTQASEWVALNPTACRPQRDSRSSEDSSRKYRCTVGCNQRFARKDTWKEHEEKVHPQKAWLCNIGLSVIEGSIRKCSFCGLRDPDMDHWHLLHPQQLPCEQKPFGRGTTIFYPRKLFISHINNIHPGVSSARYVKENCFDVPAAFEKDCIICQNYHFESWDMRVRHMGDHFLAEGPALSIGNNAFTSLASSRASGSQPRAANILVLEESDHDVLISTTLDSNASPKALDTGTGVEALARQEKLVKEVFASPKKYDLPADTMTHQELAASPEQDKVFYKSNSSEAGSFMDKVKGYLNTLIPSPFRAKALEPDGKVPRKRNEAAGSPVISLARTTKLEKGPSHLNSLDYKNIRDPISLKEELMEARIRTYDMRYFIPEDAISRMITKEVICRELFQCTVHQATSEALELLDSIIRTSRKLFGILTILDRGDALQAFLCEGVSDLDLPFSISKRRSEHLELETSSSKPISAFSQWPRRDVSDFCRDQWCFLAPHFEKGMRHLELDDSVVLPFEEHTSDGLVEGGFSSVWGVRIHPSHYDFYKAQQGEQLPRIAIKRLHSANRDRFERETHMLKQLAPKNHPHLIKLLGTYQYQHAYHLIFPFANENLRGYWQRVQRPWETPELTFWTFRQLLGIASGLETIHDFPMEDTPLNYLTVPKPSSNKPQWGRHGDIKPENILWFSGDEDDSHGRLVLADFGLMEFHGVKTRSNVDPDSIGGTPTYEPPERRLRLPISRAFDIWSMGCTMLEFISWLLEAWDGVDQFSSFRVYPIYEEYYIDAFYEILPSKQGLMYSSAVVNPRVLEWIDRLYTHEHASPMICDLLDVIRNRLLVVNANDRMTSRELVAVLDGILSKQSTVRGSALQISSASRKSHLRYDSSTEDLRQNGYVKRSKVSSEVD